MSKMLKENGTAAEVAKNSTYSAVPSLYELSIRASQKYLESTCKSFYEMRDKIYLKIPTEVFDELFNPLRKWFMNTADTSNWALRGACRFCGRYIAHGEGIFDMNSGALKHFVNKDCPVAPPVTVTWQIYCEPWERTPFNRGTFTTSR